MWGHSITMTMISASKGIWFDHSVVWFLFIAKYIRSNIKWINDLKTIALDIINAIWHCRIWSILVLVIASCLRALSHYQSQCLSNYHWDPVALTSEPFIYPPISWKSYTNCNHMSKEGMGLTQYPVVAPHGDTNPNQPWDSLHLVVGQHLAKALINVKWIS